jgi:hypothetical protein
MIWVLALHLVNITKIVLNNKVIEEPEVIVNTFNNFSIKLEQLWLKNYQKVQRHPSHILNLEMTLYSNYRM